MFADVTIPRSSIVDYETPSYYHCISRCVRREALLKDPARRRWILERLEFLSRFLAIDVVAYAIMENHLHVLIQIRPDLVRSWSDDEVARRRLGVVPRKNKPSGCRERTSPLDESPAIRALAGSPVALRRARRALADPGFFHRLLKEPCARLWNKEDDVTGHFWEGRYKSPRVLDEDSLLRVARYIDLNQVRASEAHSVATSSWTSARHQWNRLCTALQTVYSARSKHPNEGYKDLAEIDWSPAFPVIAHSSKATASGSRPLQPAGRPPKVSLLGYIWSLDRAGRRPRTGGSACISSEAPCAIRSAISYTLANAVGRRKSARERLRRWTDCVERALAQSASTSIPSAPTDETFGSRRGTCYGSRDHAAVEARRRGLRRVVVIAPS